jgi:hypothetical protein
MRSRNESKQYTLHGAGEEWHGGLLEYATEDVMGIHHGRLGSSNGSRLTLSSQICVRNYTSTCFLDAVPDSVRTGRASLLICLVYCQAHSTIRAWTPDSLETNGSMGTAQSLLGIGRVKLLTG